MPAFAMSLLATLAALMLVLAGCTSQSPDEDDPRVQVVASTNIYGQIAKEIGGDRVSVTSIITSAAQDPHGYESTARDQLAVQRAQLVIENGGGYDAFLDRLIAAATSAPVVITAVDFASEGHADEHGDDHADEADHADHEHGDDADEDHHAGHGHADEGDHDDDHAGHDHADHADHADDDHAYHADHDDHDDHADDDHAGHDHGEFNEHVWFSPAAMIALADQIAADLSVLDPEGADEFTGNAATFGAELEGVEGQLAEIRSAYAGEGIFLTEPLAGPLVDEAGLVDLAPAGFASAVESGRDVAPAALLAALRLVESGKVRAVLVNGQTGGAETTRVIDAATAVGVPIVAFTETLPEAEADADSTGPDAITTYAEWMSDNVERLATALGS